MFDQLLYGRVSYVGNRKSYESQERDDLPGPLRVSDAVLDVTVTISISKLEGLVASAV